MNSTNKILKYRTALNLTQIELAEQTGLSVRTIQRLESGSPLKGHSLKVLSEALKVNYQDLDDTVKEVETFELNHLKIINLSTLLFFIPLANVLAPLLLMHYFKEKSVIAKKLISFQIVWSLFSFLLTILSPFVQKAFDLNRQTILVVMLVCALINLFIILRNARELDLNQKLFLDLKFSLL
jgi:transcriptional regulator with XRE-family HTH domain